MTDRAVVQRLDTRSDLLRLHRRHPDRYPFLLQSTATTNSHGRYDILFAFPRDAVVAGDEPFLDALDAAYELARVPDPGCPLPFSGGWFVYLGYELAAEIEPGLALGSDPLLPTAFAVRCPAALIADRDTGELYFVHEADAGLDVSTVAADMASAERDSRSGIDDVSAPLQITESDPSTFLDAVERAKAYIAAGDVYQANLSRAWHAIVDSDLAASDLYAALCAANPAPFAGIARWQDTTIVSSSPERLLRIRNGRASTRPIAGTRPRSDDIVIDNSLSAELFAHPKERAEHVMLIDLERNDLGRVCTAGSVHVDEMMVLETYAHVHHIVSNVSGDLREDVSPGQAIAAVFPGGTITGCPKIRCMQIINELEQGPRGAYTGSFGYLNRDGSLDLNILIRTMVMRENHVTLRAGSGIVADSEPDAELEETRAKAKGMLRAFRG